MSVVIPTLKRYARLDQVLTGLARQSVEPDAFEVIVVCDAAEPRTDDVDAIVTQRPFRVRRLAAERPGASAARNTGWRAAEADLILFLDDDVRPERRLVSEHLAWHERHPDETVGVIGYVRWAGRLRATAFMRWLEDGLQFDFPAIRGTDAGWSRFYTANASVKRTLLARAGGFDEERLPYLYEDLDLALRMHQDGFRVLYNRAAVGAHMHRTSVEEWRRRLPVLARAERAFCAKHPEIEPYFHHLFSAAAAAPAARGRLAPLVRVVPRGMPLLGGPAWRSADAYYAQALASDFLRAWDAAAPEADG